MRSKFKWIFTLLIALTMQFSFAQEKTITGVVSDANGPLPGVNVVIKGTQRGVSTGFDGSYSIKAKVGETLVYSFLGMREISKEVGDSNVINTLLQDEATKLNDVVITALGIKRETKALGYSMSSLKGDNVAQSRESNVLNALSGKVAGLQVTSSSGAVGASSRIVLRGVKTITGSNSPLYIIDGVQVSESTNQSTANSGGGYDVPNTVASINPDDIESVSVLKGPNAAALYGNLASNGVIIITTKSGATKGKKVGVSFSSSLTFSNPLMLPSYQNSYGQGNDPTYYKFVDGAGGGDNDGIDESWGPALDRGYSFVQWNSFKVGGAPLPWVSHPDNVKDFFDTGVSLVNNLSLSGGSEDSNFRLSIGHSDEKGMVPFTEFKKFSVSAGANMKLAKKISFGVVANYYKDQSDNLPTVGYNSENPMQQFIWSARNVNFPELRDWRNLPGAPAGTAGEGTPMNWNNNYQNNPYWVLETNRNTFDRDRIVGAFNLGYQFTEAFSVNGKVTLDHYSSVNTTRQAIHSNSAPDGSFSVTDRRSNLVNAELLLTYTKNLGEDFKLSLNAGGNKRKTVSTNVQGIANALELPNLYTLTNLKTGTTAIYSNNYTESRTNSLLGFGQLSYKNYAFLDFTGRNDWSSVLPLKNNSFFYPSVSGSLVVTDMLGITEGPLDFLKVRASWSKVGTTGALNPYATNIQYSLVNNGWGNQAQNLTALFNNDLRPESLIGKEAGLEFEMFKRRLRFSGSYYRENTTDALIPLTVSSGSGFFTAWKNIAELENKGIELTLGGTVVKTDNFSFDVDFNFAKNKNMVKSLGDDISSYNLGGQWGVTLEAREGEAFGSIVGRGFLRDAAGNVIYENGLPKIDPVRKTLGNITPDWTGGANFSLKYKGFELATLVDAKIGGDVHSMTYAWGRYAGTLEETLIGRESGIVGNGVMSDGAGGYVPNNVVVDAQSFNKASYGNVVEESAIFDATFVKLRQISFGYSLPKKLLTGTSIDDLRLTLVGRNLAILYKKAPHIDPETGFSDQTSEQGQEFGQLPSARSYGVNLSVKF